MKGHTFLCQTCLTDQFFYLFWYYEMTLLCDLSLLFATTTMLCCKCGVRIIMRTQREVRTVQGRMSSVMRADVLLPVDENQRQQYFNVITTITIVVTTTRVLFFFISAQPLSQYPFMLPFALEKLSTNPSHQVLSFPISAKILPSFTSRSELIPSLNFSLIVSTHGVPFLPSILFMSCLCHA